MHINPRSRSRGNAATACAERRHFARRHAALAVLAADIDLDADVQRRPVHIALRRQALGDLQAVWTSPNCSPSRQEQGLRPAPVVRPAADDPRRRRHARINLPPLEHKDVHGMVYDIMNDKQRKDLRGILECDFSFEIPKLARFRVNAFNQNRGAGAVFRTIPSTILTLEELNAPKIFKDLSMQPRGLVLVTGPTGSGKSTTLAAMINHVQRERVRPHPHRRGPDRVRARSQALPDQPARGAPRHARLQRTRCARRCARTRTSSWSARCATSRRSASR
jgi:hypothetical protein